MATSSYDREVESLRRKLKARVEAHRKRKRREWKAKFKDYASKTGNGRNAFCRDHKIAEAHLCRILAGQAFSKGFETRLDAAFAAEGL